MTAHALMFVDKATFYRFIQTADERHRYEYVRGWIMQQQAGGTRRHARIAQRFLVYLSMQLDEFAWSVTGSDLAADTGDTVRYADVMVEPAAATDGKALASEAPVLLVEVLSPSSEERDLLQKPAEYMSLASLDAYIVGSQDDVLVYVWQRQADDTFPHAPVTLKGRDQVIQVARLGPRLGLAIPLAEVYRGIDI